MKVKTAVLPAAGLGTRFLPITKSIPKEMLPIVDKPLIQYAIEEAMEAGIDKIIVVDSVGKNSIADHFDIHQQLEKELEDRGKTDFLEQERTLGRMINVAFIRQKMPLGVGHAISVALPLIGDEPFAVMFCDDVIDGTPGTLKQMTDKFNELQDPIIAAMSVPDEMTHKYGILETDEKDGRVSRITGMIEKPPPGEAPTNLAIIGRYILTPDIAPILKLIGRDHTGEIQLTTALLELMKKRSIYGYEFDGTRFDAGSKIGWLQANLNYALKRPEFKNELQSYMKELKD